MIPIAMRVAQLTHRWDLRTPVLIRYMPKQYVDDFFEHGRLRLSSFFQFSKHVDEARNDNDEGFCILEGTDEHQAVIAAVRQGHSSYVLCGSTREDPAVQAEFGCDSYFRISNTHMFAREIAKKVPNFKAGLEGHCIYTGVRSVRQRLVITEADLPTGHWKGTMPDDKRLRDVLARLADHPDAYLLKNYKYKSQCEYRIVWHTTETASPTLDVVCPEAIAYCDRP